MYIGIDLGGTNIAVGLVDEQGNIIRKESIPTGAKRHYSEIIKDMADLSKKVCADSGVSLDDIKSIGIGSPGTCDDKNGILVYANNLNFLNVPMRAEMQKHIDKPVFIGNDANVAALAEYYNAGIDMECFVAITLGTGVGGGVIINGKIFTGFNNAAGELGHMVIVSDGYPCTCGRKGCWESYASATALIRQTKVELAVCSDSLMYEMTGGDLEKVSGKTAFGAARNGDESALKVVNQYINYVAIGVANLINIFQPEMLVIGGGICKEGDYLLNPIKEICKNQTYSRGGIKITELGIAKLGNDAGIIGAAFLGK